MPERTSIFLALALVGLMAPASRARAEDYITVNGLPCGTFCRAWMGIKLPAEKSTAGEETPAPRADEEPRREREGHKTKPAKVPRSAVARAKAEPTRAETARVKTRAGDANQTAEKKIAPTPVATSTAAAPEPTAVAKDTPAPTASATPVAKDTPAPTAAPTPVAKETPAPLATETLEPTIVAAPQTVAPAPVATQTPAPVVAASTPDPVAAPSPTPESRAEDASASTKPPETPPNAAPVKDSSATAAGGDKPAPTTEAPKVAAPEVAAADPGAKIDDERRILIVLAKLDVKDIADLHDKTVVLAGVAAISDGRLKAAFAAAGAGGAQFKQGAINDVDEVGTGSVAAAIVAVVKPEIASAFPEVPGYRLLRVEVAP